MVLEAEKGGLYLACFLSMLLQHLRKHLICFKPILQSGYIKKDSRPNSVMKLQFTKESIRAFSLSLSFVSHSSITLIFELDYVVEL